MYQYRGEGLTSQRPHPPRPPLSVPDPIHTHPQNIGYLPPAASSLPPAQQPLQHQISRMPHRQSESGPSVVPSGPGPAPYSTVFDGKIWSLSVMQQPIRARMCGFGDKDRRPITPPPCILLEVLDAETRQEINLNDIDTSFFVLTVDLWDASGTEEQNLVKNPANSPSIGNADAMSYPSFADSAVQPNPATFYQNGYSSDARYPPPNRQNAQYAGSNPYNVPPPPPSAYGPPPSTSNGYPYHHGYPPPSPYNTSPMTPGGHYSQQMMPPTMHSQDMMSSPPSANPPQYNRNLIGSLSASAFQLTDTVGKLGIWFIMQDLSVRQEGVFRLKMSFVDVGDGTSRNKNNPVTPQSSSPNGRVSNGLKQTAPVLASCFSEPFQVFSAKRFPGVIESTNLSKCFANQGIKIPIRQNDAGNKRGRDDDSDDNGDAGEDEVSPGEGAVP